MEKSRARHGAEDGGGAARARSQYYSRRPLHGSDLLPVVGIGVGIGVAAGLAAFYVARLFFEREPLESAPAAPTEAPPRRRSAK